MEQWILLTLRCLIPLVLGLALAQPFFGDGNWFAGPTHQYIIIDNGVSTTTTPQGGSSEFEQLRSHTADFIRSGNRGDRVTIITTTGSPENNRSTGDLEQAALYVDSMKPSFLETDLQFSLDEAITTITNTKNDVQNEIIVFSPFRGGSIRNTTDTTRKIPDNTSLRFSTPASADLANVRFTSIEPLRRFILRDKQEAESGRSSLGRTATASLVRDGTTLPPKETSITTSLNGNTTHKTYQWKTGQQQAEVEIQLPVDTTGGESTTITVTIDDTDANMADNSWYLSLDTVEQLNFLILDRLGGGSTDSNQSRWLEFALNPGELESLDTRVMDPIAIMDSDLEELDVLVIARPELLEESGIELVGAFLENNGTVILFPPADREIHNWTGDVQRALNTPWRWEEEARTFPDPVGIQGTVVARQYLAPIAGDLPVLLESIRVQKSLELTPLPGADVLLTLDDGSPLVIVSAQEEDKPGSIIHITTPMNPSWTDLPTKPLMVPLFQELIRNSLSEQRVDRQRVVGESFVVSGTSLVSDGGFQIPIDIDSGKPTSAPGTPGHWTLMNRNNEAINSVSINLNPESTNTVITDVSRIPTLLGDSGDWVELSPGGFENPELAGSGSSLTRSLLLLLLIIVAAETLCSRLFTHTPTRSGSGGAT